MKNESKNNQALEMFEKLQTSDDSKIDTNELAKRNTGGLKKVWGSVQTLYSVAKGQNIPISVKAIAVGALLYVVLPLDVIPDYIPVIGLADDAFVVMAAMYKLTTFLESPLGKIVVSQSSAVLKKAIRKSKNMVKEFTQSDTGKEIINTIKVFVNQKSDIVIEDIKAKILEAMQTDKNYGAKYFKSKQGKTILAVDGEEIIEAVTSDQEDDSLSQELRNAIINFVETHGKDTVAQAINETLKIVGDLVRKKMSTT